MQILKSLSLLCAAAVTVTVASAQSDNDAQTKAREALRQKLDELQNNPPPQQTAPAPVPAEPKPVPAPKVKKMPTPAPVTKGPAPVETAPPRRMPAPMPRQERIAQPTPAPAQTPAPVRVPEPTPKAEPVPEVVIQPKPDSEAIAKAREAMREKMNALEARQPAPLQPAPPTEVRPTPMPAPVPVRPRRETVTTPPPRVMPAPRMTEQPAPPATQSAAPVRLPESGFSPQEPIPGGQPDSLAARRELEKKEAELAARQTSRESVPMTQQPRKTNRRRIQPQPETPTYQPLEAPPLPISANKQQELANLLRRYQADEITPSQYHQERAKILAQP